MNEEIMRAAGYAAEVDAVKRGECPFCHVVVDPNTFKDKESKDEWIISGLCQACQDLVYKP